MNTFQESNGSASEKVKFTLKVLGYLVLGAGLMAWGLIAFSIKEEVPSTDLTSNKESKSTSPLIEGCLTPQTAETTNNNRRIDSMFLTLAADPESVPTVLKLFDSNQQFVSNFLVDISANIKVPNSIEAKNLVLDAIERSATNPKFLKGVAVFCSAVKSKSVRKDSFGFSFWKSMEDLATVCITHSELKITLPLKFLKFRLNLMGHHHTQEESRVNFPDFSCLDAELVKLIKPEKSLLPFFKAVAEYRASTVQFLDKGGRFSTYLLSYTNNTKLSDNMNVLLKITAQFFISENEKRYPKFTETYDKFVIDFEAEMNCRLLSEHIKKPDSLFSYHRVDKEIVRCLDYEFIDEEYKKKAFDAFMYNNLIELMTRDVVDFSKVTYDPRVVEEYQVVLTEAYFLADKLWCIYIMSQSVSEPSCDSEGKWVHTIRMVRRDQIVIQMMDEYCANNKGKSAKPFQDELEAKMNEILRKSREICGIAVQAYGAKIFNNKPQS